MDRVALLENLCALFSAFQRYWLADDNCFRNDGNDITVHGICACFSQYFSESLDEHGDGTLAALFAMIEPVIANDAEDACQAANALTTCFLESLAGAKSGARTKGWMGTASRRYFDLWDRPAQQPS